MNFLDNTAKDGFDITPGPTEFAVRAQAIYVGGNGDVTLKTEAGTTLTFFGVVAGSTLPISAVAVTASTASNLIGYLP